MMKNLQLHNLLLRRLFLAVHRSHADGSPLQWPVKIWSASRPRWMCFNVLTNLTVHLIRKKVRYPLRKWVHCNAGWPQNEACGYLAIDWFTGFRVFKWVDNSVWINSIDPNQVVQIIGCSTWHTTRGKIPCIRNQIYSISVELVLCRGWERIIYTCIIHASAYFEIPSEYCPATVLLKNKQSCCEECCLQCWGYGP